MKRGSATTKGPGGRQAMTSGRPAAASGAATADGLRCVVQAHDLLGETPIWCPRSRALWWIDIERPRLHRYDPATGSHAERAFVTDYLGSLALRRAGGFLVALGSALHTFDPESGVLAPFATVEDAALGNRLNDGRADAAGRFWIGSMDLSLHRPQGAFYCVHPDGRVVRQFDGIIVSNTVAIAPDQRTLYVSDTRRFVVWAFDLDPAAGTLARRRVFVDHTATGDRPDGACIDADGHLWIAMFGGGRVVRHAPDGGDPAARHQPHLPHLRRGRPRDPLHHHRTQVPGPRRPGAGAMGGRAAGPRTRPARPAGGHVRRLTPHEPPRPGGNSNGRRSDEDP